jgi:outer membrane protein assembly factor BamB
MKSALPLRSLFVIIGALLAPIPAVGQQVTAATLPLKDKDAYSWLFFDDIVLGIDYGGTVTKDARVNAYSLAQPRLLWRLQDIEASHFTYMELRPHTPDYGEKVLYIGNGPFAALDVTRGAVRWTKSCDEAGFIMRDIILPIGAAKLLIVGSDKCKWRRGNKDDIAANLDQDKKLMLLNRSSGQVVWTHRAKAQNKTPGKFWACGLLTCSGSYRFNQQFAVIPLARGGEGGYHYSTGDDVDRLLVVGERLEAINFADGTTLWQTKDEVGNPAGIAGKFLFFVKDDKLSAFELGGAGTPVWSSPIHASSADVFVKAVGDSEDTSPLAPGDLFVSTPDALFRLDLATGSQKWTIKLGNAAWQLRDGLLLVETEEKVTAYDFSTGTPKWEMKGGKQLNLALSVQAGSVLVGLFVDRGDYHRDEDEYVGPYRFWGVDLASGTVLWTLADLDGKKIVRYGRWGPQLRMWGEHTVKCRSITIADGKPAGAPPQDVDVSVVYFRDDKTVRAQNWAGDLVWERQGEPTDWGVATLREQGIVIVPLKSGTVEVIKLADGASLWKQDVGGDPRLHLDGSGHNLVIQRGDKVTLVHVTP